MSKQIVVGDVYLSVGDKLRVNSRGCENGYGPTGNVVEVVLIQGLQIGLYSKRKIHGWHDLDGTVSDKQGWWASRDALIDNFDVVVEDYTIAEEVMFKKRNLRGMQAKLLCRTSLGDSCFVEVDQNVGGVVLTG